MGAAVVRASYYGGAAVEPTTGTTAEGSTMVMNRDDTFTGTTVIPIPTGGIGTNYSWHKELALDVTSTGTTSLSNRTVLRSSAPTAGLILYFASSSAYLQPTSTNMPANTATGDGATPAGWTALTTSAQAYSTASAVTSSGRNGGFCKILLGVSSTGTYTGGAGSAIALPTLSLGYDES